MIAQMVQFLFSALVVFVLSGFRVIVPIDFDNKSFLSGNEIHNVITNNMLP